MGRTSFTGRDGRLRLYDGTATPYFLEIAFVNADFRAPMNRPRPEEIVVLDRGRITSAAHYILGAGDPILQPVQLSFSFRLHNTEPNYRRFRQALNVDMPSAWTVGAFTWVTTKGTTTVISDNPEGVTNVTTNPFVDPRKRCVNVEVLWADPGGSADVGSKFGEVYFPPNEQNLAEGADDVMIQATGYIYGGITEITAFTAGTSG